MPATYTRNEWVDFQSRFGPLHKTLQKIDSLFDERNMMRPWFSGYMVEGYDKKLCKRPGHFLVRFPAAQTKQHRLALCYVSRTSGKHRLVHINNSDQGYYCAGLTPKGQSVKFFQTPRDVSIPGHMPSGTRLMSVQFVEGFSKWSTAVISFLSVRAKCHGNLPPRMRVW